MGKVQIFTWEEMITPLVNGELYIRCSSGQEKKRIKDILIETIGGRTCEANNNYHLYLYNIYKDTIYWDACVKPQDAKKWMNSDEFFEIFQGMKEEPIDLTALL